MKSKGVFDLYTELVSGGHVWYRAMIAGALVEWNNQCFDSFLWKHKKKDGIVILGRNALVQTRLPKPSFADLSSPLVCALRKRPTVNGIKKTPMCVSWLRYTALDRPIIISKES